MRTSMVKRYFCLLVALLFIIPSVTALNVGIVRNQNENNDIELNECNVLQDEDFDNVDSQNNFNDFIPADKMSVDVQEILKNYPLDELDQETKEYLVRFNEKMLERRERFELEYLDLPYVPLDITKDMAKFDPQTGEISPLFPGAELMAFEEKLVYFPYYPFSTGNNLMNSEANQPSSSTRSARALPAADLRVDEISWTAINDGWGNYFEEEDISGDQFSIGGFQVGRETTITVKIANDGPATSVSNVKVNLTVLDWDSGIPLQKNPSTKTDISFSGSETNVAFKFTPAFSGRPLIMATVDYPNDMDYSNNGIYMNWGPYIFIWSADFESSGTNYGWQKLVDSTTPISNSNSDWTGDKGTTNSQWHVTDSPANQLLNEHTRTHAMYHGNDGTPDSYEDNIPRNLDDDGRNHTYLESPRINMGNIFDGQKYRGDYDDNTFSILYTPMYGAMITGELEMIANPQSDQEFYQHSDFVFMRDYADDATGTEWRDPFLAYYGYVWSNYAQIFSDQTTDHWNPLMCGFPSGTQMALFVGYPFNLLVGDGQGGHKDAGGATNWTQYGGPRFRCDFTGDGENDQDLTDVGAYFDDFAAWGRHDYTVEHRVGITELTYPESDMDGNIVPVLFKDKSFTFSSTVENFGRIQNVPVVLSIFEIEDNGVMATSPIHTQTQQAQSLANDAEKEHSWSWSPTKAGDFMLKLKAGDPNLDWTAGDNEREFLLHVGPVDGEADVDILVVDDDARVGGTGVYYQDTRTWNYIYSRYINLANTEGKMLKALTANELKYRVYTVGYNETGPSFDIMSQFELVIWMTGLDNEFNAHGSRSNYKFTNPAWDVTLKTDDLTELEKFLNLKDKKFWLISPGFI